jgi:hypothetical protein
LAHRGGDPTRCQTVTPSIANAPDGLLFAGQLGQLLQSGAGAAMTETVNLYDAFALLKK